MRSEGLAIGVVLAFAAYPGLAQTESLPRVGGWQSQGGSSTASKSLSAPKSAGPAPSSPGKLAPIPNDRTGIKARLAKVTKGTGTLPNEHGQVWREYDISSYTLSVTSTDRPEQAIVDPHHHLWDRRGGAVLECLCQGWRYPDGARHTPVRFDQWR